MPKYYNIWNNHLAEIYYLLDKAHFTKTIKAIQLDQKDFHSIGNRISSGYTFNLEIKNGIVLNDISGTIVARDLHDIMGQDEHLKYWMQNKKIKINLDGNFKLTLRCT